MHGGGLFRQLTKNKEKGEKRHHGIILIVISVGGMCTTGWHCVKDINM